MKPDKLKVRLTVEGFLGIVIGCCILGASFVQNINLLLLIFAIIVGVCVSSWRICRRNLRGARASRRLPEEAFAGEDVEIHIELKRDSARGRLWGATVRDGVKGERGLRFGPPVNFYSLIGDDGQRRSYRLTAPERGRIVFERIRISSRFPLGVFESRIDRIEPDELIIYPRIGRLLQMWRNRMHGRHAHLATRTPDSGVNDFDFHSLREYRAGDSLRHVHWRTTARRGELMVKEFEPLDSLDTLLLIDPWFPKKETEKAVADFEAMISFVATCVVELCRWPGNRLVIVIGTDPPTVLDRQTSPRTAEAILTELALLQPSLSNDLGRSIDAIPIRHDLHPVVWAVSLRDLLEYEASLVRRFGNRFAREEAIRFLNVSQGDLAPIFAPAETPIATPPGSEGSVDRT